MSALAQWNSRSESNSTTTVANASEVKAGGDVNVTSTKKDINITGSNVVGKDVTLNAKENLNVIASETTNKLEQNSKSRSASVGEAWNLAKAQATAFLAVCPREKCLQMAQPITKAL